MNQIPLYIVTSFLSTGKTAFINRMTKHNDRVAVIAFEEGMQELTKPHISVSYNGDGKISADSVQEVVHFIETQKPDALWLEWNGMAPHYVLEAIRKTDEAVLRNGQQLRAPHAGTHRRGEPDAAGQRGCHNPSRRAEQP